MPRRRTVALAILVLLLAAAPFVPRSRGPEGAITPSDGSSRATASVDAWGTVTPAMQAEIDRVVADGLAQPSYRGKAAPDQLAARQVRCATFEGLTYCLHVGWTEQSPSEARSTVAAAARTSYAGKAATTVVNTGDLDPLAALGKTARLSPEARAAQERFELVAAARSVAKVWVIRHEIEGMPYPRGFLARHPEALALTRSAAVPQTTKPGYDAYPGRDKVLSSDQVAEQSRSYWCGPTSTQMIVWGWTDERVRQGTWAHRLGTTSNGTDIGSIVRVVNKYTGWDRKDHAGPYITLDIGKYRYKKWYTLVMRHIHDYQAPIVMHPILLKRYFSYLAGDASGHYQVGRGYAKRGDKPDLVGYFEPWNQRRFDPSEPFIKRVQWHLAYQSFRANKAHPYHNIGV